MRHKIPFEEVQPNGPTILGSLGAVPRGGLARANVAGNWADHGGHLPVGLPVHDGFFVHADFSGHLFLKKAEIESSLAQVIAECY